MSHLTRRWVASWATSPAPSGGRRRSAQSTPSFDASWGKLQARVLATMEHSKCTSGADVMGRLNRRDDTDPARRGAFVP